MAISGRVSLGSWFDAARVGLWAEWRREIPPCPLPRDRLVGNSLAVRWGVWRDVVVAAVGGVPNAAV